jgi:nitric oxide reductase NorQ protein
LSRAHPEAWNILMTVLDEGQRYLRLDEDINSPTIRVASGVSFIATANIGTEYTSTRVLDRALMDRFEIIEVDILSLSQEEDLLTKRFGDKCPCDH